MTGGWCAVIGEEYGRDCFRDAKWTVFMSLLPPYQLDANQTAKYLDQFGVPFNLNFRFRADPCFNLGGHFIFEGLTLANALTLSDLIEHEVKGCKWVTAGEDRFWISAMYAWPYLIGRLTIGIAVVAIVMGPCLLFGCCIGTCKVAFA